MAFSSNVLSIERSGPVGTLWLDRAEKRNAMSAEMWTALPAAMAELGSDPGVRAVVLAARGKSFCVGLDLAAFGSGGAVDGSGGGGVVSQATANLKQLEVTRGFQAAISSVALDRVLNGWKLSFVMTHTARGGLPLPLRAVWPLLIKRVAFVRRLIEQAEDGLPIEQSKRKVYEELVAQLEGGPFLAGRPEPSLPDFSAYPQFALYYMVGFRGGDAILQQPELMDWLKRMRPYLEGSPRLLPAKVCLREMP